MKKILTYLFLLLAVGLFGQTRPDQQPYATTIQDSDAFYSQNRGSLMQFRVDTLIKYFTPDKQSIQRTYTPGTDAVPYADRYKIIQAADDNWYYIDADRDYIQIGQGGGSGSTNTVTLITSISDTTSISSPVEGDIIYQDEGLAGFRDSDRWRIIYGFSNGDKGDFTVSSGIAVIDNDVISTLKIIDDAVTAAKLADNSVGADQLQSTSVTPGTYSAADVTVDQDGRITNISNGNANSFGLLLTDYGSLNSALSAVNSTRKTVIIDSSLVLNSNITIPDSVDLQFVDGGSIDLSNDTLFLNGSLNAPFRKIFDASGGGVITGNTFTKTWYSEWFGAKTNDSTYDSEAFIHTGQTIRNIGGGTFQLLAGTYRVDTAASVYSNTILQGRGMGVTVIEAPTDTLEVRYQLRGAQRRLYAFLVGEYGGGDVENVVAQDMTIRMNDTQIGNGADEINNWPTNWGTQPVGAHLWNEATGIGTGTVRNLRLNRIEMRDINACQPVLRDAGGQVAGTDIPYNEDIVVENCIIDSTANKAIEYQEIRGGYVRGNTILNSASGFQAINFCKNIQVYDNYIEFTHAGIITSSEIEDLQIRDNYVRYSGGAPSTNFANPYGACIGFKQEEEQSYFTTKQVRVEGNTLDNTLNTQDTFHTIAFWHSADTADFHDIQIIGNKHIRGTVGLYNIRNKEVTPHITITDNISFVNEIDVLPIYRPDEHDHFEGITFQGCDFRQSSDTLTFVAKNWAFKGNDMRKIRLELEAESDTNNTFAYNIVNDTSNIVASAPHFYGYNIVTGLSLEVDTTSPPAVSYVAEWTGDFGVTTAADAGRGIDTIVSWADKTGNGHTLQPIWDSGVKGIEYSSSTVNGVRYLVFTDATGGSRMLETIDTITYGNSWSVFMLARPKEPTSYAFEFESDNSSVSNMRIYDATRSEDIGGVVIGNNVDQISAGGTNDWAFYNWNRSANLVTLTRNSTTYTTDDIVTTASEEITKTQFGGRYWPPTRNETDEFDVLHIIIYDRAATAQEISDIRSAWATKYGLTF